MSNLIYGSFGWRDDETEPYRWWEQTNFRYIECYCLEQPLHWAQIDDMQWFNEIWLIHEGQCEIKNGSKTTTACKGDIVVITSGARRETRSVGKQMLHLSGFNFFLPLSAAQDALSLFDLPLCLTVSEASPTRFDLRVLFEQLIKDTVEHRAGYNFAAPALAQLILGEVVSAAQPHGETPAEFSVRMRDNLERAINDDVSRVLGLIHKSYKRPLTIDDLARAACLSVAQMARKFKTSVGMSPMDYVRVYRLERAKEELRDSIKTIADIAFECGFDDPSYFSRQFKSLFGLTPRTFRKSIQACNELRNIDDIDA